jgi:hypothetical protein
LLPAEVPDRTQQSQPNYLIGVGHRDQRGEVGGGGPRRERPQDLRSVGAVPSLQDALQLGKRGRTKRG